MNKAVSIVQSQPLEGQTINLNDVDTLPEAKLAYEQKYGPISDKEDFDKFLNFLKTLKNPIFLNFVKNYNEFIGLIPSSMEGKNLVEFSKKRVGFLKDFAALDLKIPGLTSPELNAMANKLDLMTSDFEKSLGSLKPEDYSQLYLLSSNFRVNSLQLVSSGFSPFMTPAQNTQVVAMKQREYEFQAVVKANSDVDGVQLAEAGYAFGGNDGKLPPPINQDESLPDYQKRLKDLGYNPKILTDTNQQRRQRWVDELTASEKLWNTAKQNGDQVLMDFYAARSKLLNESIAKMDRDVKDDENRGLYLSYETSRDMMQINLSTKDQLIEKESGKGDKADTNLINRLKQDKIQIQKMIDMLDDVMKKVNEALVKVGDGAVR